MPMSARRWYEIVRALMERRQQIVELPVRNSDGHTNNIRLQRLIMNNAQVEILEEVAGFGPYVYGGTNPGMDRRLQDLLNYSLNTEAFPVYSSMGAGDSTHYDRFIDTT